MAALIPEARSQSLQKGLDRKKIAGIIFKNEALRKQVEEILHPFVFNQMAERIRRSEHTMIILEVPLLFETGFHQACHHTVVVNAPDPLIDERLKRKGFTRDEIAARRQAQSPLADKVKQADFVIENTQSIDQTQQDAQKVWDQICAPFREESN